MSTALVTGATAGIGLAFARQLAERHWDLVLVARDAERLERTADDLRTTYGVEVTVLPADLTDRADLRGVEDRLASPSEPVDLLVNNAGFGLKRRFLDNSADEETAMTEVLVIAPLRLSHAALTAMTGRGHGGVINVGSVASYLPRGTYSAAKAWINSFTEWAHNEYRPRGVTVMALLPGFTRTEFHERMGVSRQSAPDWMWLDVDQLVAEALADYEKGKAFSVPSARYKVLATAARMAPTRFLQRFQLVGRK
ncbi:SDR family NAD(P)-dependent oxidoreductase [Nocardioides sp.]|uniref:SDR family NAD(P)-dependent oxidoreductase n=1 Tax=Nocardioides sp. TaxID=35761 RepID=UPI0039E3F4EF